MLSFQEAFKNAINVEEFRKEEEALKVGLSSEQKVDIEGKIIKYINSDEKPLQEVAELIKFQCECGEESFEFICARMKNSADCYYIPYFSPDKDRDKLSSIFRLGCFSNILLSAICKKENLSKLKACPVQLYRVIGIKSCFVLHIQNSAFTRERSLEKIKNLSDRLSLWPQILTIVVFCLTAPSILIISCISLSRLLTFLSPLPKREKKKDKLCN